ncbi:beta-ketoacyl synthase N-terminal-like domain-containing protein [Streptomyces sp. DSM 40473]|uniref:Beta-ketoacyl synthase N-terminal-like domain-containing protein n=2 Tax=Streptomyces hesseae TaxID=3075519 RepID=A0ABU2SGS0_9ACTN|nr:polyketide synthase [Streptomyces sp. DSM 40473]MDT0448179.1 beta-ketoacyl synthase N-terminal-like domain-containing protein [Streptomyces sp. DSM 40473]
MRHGRSGNPAQEPVAVTGMAVTLPGADDLDRYWHNLRTGVDAITETPPGRWDEDEYRSGAIYCRRGGFVDDRLTGFDPVAFGIMPDSVPATEPDQLIALRTAAAAIADAGGLSTVDPARTGVVLGRGGYLTAGLARLDQRVRTAGQLTRTLRELLPELGEERLTRVRTAFEEALGPDSPEAVIGLVPNFAASRIANRLDLRGPAYTVDAACASSLLAVDQAVGELTAGRCDVMLAGGVHHCHDVTLWSVFARLGALSPTQRIRPFHRDADGVLIGEGTAVLVLKRLADAVRAGDRVYAVIRGTGVAGDGRAATLVNPDPDGQTRAVRLAWEAAGLDPAAPGAIGLLEAHGTGTPNGDAAEITTLRRVFGTPRAPDAVIGSVKSMIGHTMPAAGAAGLVKAALALHHQVLPPTLHCDDPHPGLLATRFRPSAVARPWEAEVRRAGVNAFGFGGINAHVVLEEFHPTAGRRRSSSTALHVAEPEPVLRIAADTTGELRALLDAEDALLRAGGDIGTGGARLAVAGPGGERLALARKAVARGRAWGGRREVWFAPRPLLGPAGGGRTAFLFPGLEAGFTPQGEDVARHFGLPRPTWQQARVGAVAEHGAGVVDAGRLLATALRRAGVTPDALAGHSVGEWAAMAVGGIFADKEVDAFLKDFDPLALLVPDLVFMTFGAPADQVEAALAGIGEVVLSHDNAPHQSVICGPAAQVEKVTERLRRDGVIGRALPFASGFHTPMLAPYLGPIREAMRRFTLHRPSVPVWSGTTCAPFPDRETEVRELAVRHLLEPVRFRGLVESLYASGFRAFVQAGQGQLPALTGDILAGREHLAVTAAATDGDGLGQLRRAVAGLWAYGAEPDVAALHPRGGRAIRTVPAPPAGTPERTGVRLGLDAGPVRLEPVTRDRLRTVLREALTGGGTPGVPQLDGVAGRFAEAAQLRALLTETADTAAALFAAHDGPGSSAPVPVRTTAIPDARTSRPGPATPRPTADPGRTTTVRVALDTMPYLADHCFYRQRPDWPDIGDRWPVVPATTMIRHMSEAVAAPPGTGVTVAVRGARFLAWLVAEPAVDVAVTVRGVPGRPGRHTVEFGRYARAETETAPRHPAPPARWPVPAGEETPTVSARRMYDERWMFHGPLFQGVTTVTGIGARHVRGVLTAPPAPGALLDNAGQLLGYWLMATRSDRTVVLPAGIRDIRFHGPEPTPGQRLDCHIRITSLTETLLAADIQLSHRGTVWCEIDGWEDRRFDSPPATDAIRRHPEHSTLARIQPGGWHLVFEHWPDPASRELMMRNVLGGAERDAYAARSPQGRQQWLLGRIAAKDAVRHHLWRHGAGPVYPAEIRVRNDDSGRPHPEGVHGRELPPLELSLAHCAEAAVALVRPAGTAPTGIDIEEITERPTATHDAVLAPEEIPLHNRLGGDARTLVRFWAAKEAAAKAEGTGLRGRPRDFRVTTADDDRLTVRTPSGRTHSVSLAETRNPAGLRPRRYVVAWTEDTHRQHHEETPS